MPRRLFALDQNFPQPIVSALSEFMAEAELVALADIDARLTDLDDGRSSLRCTTTSANGTDS